MNVQGKVGLITGAAGGIGFAIAKELLRNDIQGLVLTDINEAQGKKSLQKLQEEFSPERIIFLKLDTTSEDQYEDAFKQAIITFGTIDIVINNAGIVNETNYCKTVNINLVGVLHGTLIGIRHMSKSKGGKGGVILNIASLAALITAGLPIYSTTKSGVVMLSRNFGKKYYHNATGVRVIALCPGFTDTDLLANYKPEDVIVKDTWNRADIHMQKVDSVARGAIYVIKNAESGSACVVNDGKLYKANVPDWIDICELVEENL